LKDAAENYPAWISAIESAGRWIHFETYIIHDDAIGRRFADLLSAKAREGVRVRLIYDWIGSLGYTSRRFRRRMIESGGDVRRCINRDCADTALQKMTTRGFRVLAVAWRPIERMDPLASPEQIETGLELLGLIAIQDPPRPGIAESVAACRRAGIAVAMVTGDHPQTARAIAKQVGLLGAEDWVLEGRDLPQEEHRLGALVDRDGIVLSRVTPEDKLRIARALRARGHVVAMTGDGVNDGPALQEASIGIAMGRSGTDVAREAADLVLLDDNFETIVAAVK
jgi:magnesium-transporting ATPase (P-type)